MATNGNEVDPERIDTGVLLARTRGLYERLETTESGARDSSEGGPDAGSPLAYESKELRDAWYDQLSPDSRSEWEARLTRFDIDSVTEDLSEWSLPAEEPDWIETITTLVEFLATHTTTVPVEPVDERPFEHVLTAITSFAIRRLDDDLVDGTVDETGVDALRRGLEERLQRTLGQALFVEFKSFSQRADGCTPSTDDSTTRPVYTSFVETLLEDGMASFFEEYAVAARLVATMVDQWVDYVETFVERVEADREAICDRLSDENSLGSVTEVSFDGDPHDGGRQVARVSFESGTTVAYKPRSVSANAAFDEFLTWVASESDLPVPVRAEVIEGDGYGWVEWIEREACTDERAVSRYYRRVGVLSAFLYVLRFTDGNYTNIVAVGDSPALVDLESVCHPSFPDRDGFESSHLASVIDESVLATGLFPIRTADDGIEGVGGLDEPGERESPIPTRCFRETNTDQMELEFDYTRTLEARNLPTLDGESVPPAEYVDDLVAGFEAASEFVLDNQTRLTDRDGPLSVFDGIETRLFLRSTMEYGRVRRPMVTTKYLRSDAKRDTRAEALLRRADLQTVGDDCLSLFRGERAALRRGDVPRLSVQTDRRTVRCGGWRAENVLDESPFEQVRQRIATLDEGTLTEQADYLRLAYDPESFRRTPAPTRPPETPDLDDTTLRRAVRRRVERLRSQAVEKTDGTVGWFLRENRGDGVYVHDVRQDLYEGRLGIALFGAAAVTVLDDTTDAEWLYRTAIDPVLDEIESEDSVSTDKPGICHGRGSLVYGLVKLWELRSDPRLLDAAERVGETLAPEFVAETGVHDVIGGTAGGILALLTLWNATNDETYRERAVALGDVLLENRVTIDGTLVWETFDGPEQALVGMGHGVSGIATALARLGAVTDTDRFTRAALESLDYERSAYDTDSGGWPDYRTGSCRRGWCAGRAGIALTRAEILATDLDEENETRLETDLNRALDGFDPDVLLGRDHICCGNAGRVVALLRLSTRLQRRDLREQAVALAAETLARADGEEFTFSWTTAHWDNPTLFSGEAGVGYVFARLLDDTLPALIVFE